MSIKYLDTSIFKQITSNINPNDLELVYKSKNIPNGYEFFRLDSSSDLFNEIISLFPEPVKTYIKTKCILGLQSFNSNFNNYLYQDRYRSYAINYTLLQGGSNVTTSVYDNLTQQFQTYDIPEKTWYWFNTKYLHKLDNISSTRTEISISLLEHSLSNDVLNWLDSVSQ